MDVRGRPSGSGTAAKWARGRGEIPTYANGTPFASGAGVAPRWILLSFLPVTLGCQSTTQREVTAPGQPILQRQGPGPSLALGEVMGDAKRVRGRVVAPEACTKSPVTNVRTKTTQAPSAGRFVWYGVGGLMLGGGAYALQRSGSASDGPARSTQTIVRVDGTERTVPGGCEYGEHGSGAERSCNSERDALRAVGLIGLGAGLATIAGTMLLSRSATSTSLEQPPRVRVGSPVAATCVPDTATLDGAKLSLTTNLRRIETSLFADGTFEFTPPDGFGEGERSGEIELTSVPPALARTITPSVLGSVTIDTAALTSERLALLQKQRREADSAQVFTGAVRGDVAAKAAFTQTCIASGPDTCFDATDNDCDGRYDVGCGYESGALQWTLAWKTGDDLDLHVVGPDGSHVFFGKRDGGAAALKLDVDCLGSFGSNCLRGGNIENVFSPPEQPPMEGTYIAWVEAFRVEESADARQVSALVGGRVGGRAFRLPISLPAQQGARVTFAFALGEDADGDAVIDRQDACPKERGVPSRVAAENGCPDGDGDGVADSVDECPLVAGIRRPKKNGCPETFGLARLTSRGVEFDGTIEFNPGAAILSPRSTALLHDVGEVMRKRASALVQLSIEGHTDSDGDDAANLKLSRDRAHAVFDFLTKRERIAPRRLSPVLGWGETRPLVGNDTEQGKAKNRRVDLRVLVPAPTHVETW